MEELKIIQTAGFIPEKEVKNADLAQIMSTSDEWIQTRTGIKKRHISLQANTSDLCIKVAQKLLEKSQISAQMLDLIIVATMSPDSTTPATAAIVQGALNAKNAYAFDISAACAGFVYGLKTAANFLKDPKIKYVLLIGGEVLSKLVAWDDRSTAVLFGDGAAGALLAIDQQTESGILGSDLKTFGQFNTSLTAAKTQPLSEFPPKTNEKRYTPFMMDGRAVYNFATEQVPRSLRDACQDAGLSLAEIDLFLLHQANERIIKSIAKRLDLPLAKFPLGLAELGNTSAASIPLLLDDLIQSKKVTRGQTLALCGFGGGLTIGTLIIKF
ncbi:beta-ketoacyl-ACP synthase III [Ligilactobacillus faecis]|uniref:beta-ketoacyl-ACP synthase III n=1 Tax=Ligilactobacillus faecis TaxID=762833 RepID=UPI0024684179|nr:beta-ketoacyl-ACP synthase III [Ligilactobacillus faecis]WGN89098.1 ketoacyl-ACP synthase III [Ligilactobacillus faecis]